jgi:hypothetical protein
MLSMALNCYQIHKQTWNNLKQLSISLIYFLYFLLILIYTKNFEYFILSFTVELPLLSMFLF